VRSVSRKLMFSRIEREVDSVSRRYRAYDRTVLRRLDDLADLMDIEVHYGGVSGAAARMTMGPGGFVLRVNERDRDTPTGRFSIGHELGHYWLHRRHAMDARCSVDDMRTWHSSRTLETEANAFAAAFLLPSLLVEEALDGQAPSMDIVRSLAGDFGMSLTATAIRLVRLSEEPCAVVVATAGSIDFVIRGDDFWPWIESGVPLHPSTLAYDCHALGRLARSDQEPVAAFAWLADRRLQNAKWELLEHTCFSPRLGQTLSLLWARDLPFEDELDEEENDDVE